MSDVYSSISNKFFRRSGRLNRLKHLILQLALIGADMAFFVLLFILAVISSASFCPTISIRNTLSIFWLPSIS